MCKLKIQTAQGRKWKSGSHKPGDRVGKKRQSTTWARGTRRGKMFKVLLCDGPRLIIGASYPMVAIKNISFNFKMEKA